MNARHAPSATMANVKQLSDRLRKYGEVGSTVPSLSKQTEMRSTVADMTAGSGEDRAGEGSELGRS